jgi:hypothetical protein
MTVISGFVPVVDGLRYLLLTDVTLVGASVDSPVLSFHFQRFGRIHFLLELLTSFKTVVEKLCHWVLSTV